MIYCIGDSHSAVFSGEETMQPEWPELSSNSLPYFKSYRIGPATAYKIHNKQNIIESVLEHAKPTKEDQIMFCFGEVDCRAHLIKQSNLQERTIEDVTEECVDRYLDSLLNYSKYNVPIIIWGPIASWNQNKVYTGPSFGTNQERNNVTKLFNEYLKEKCALVGMKYISIFYEMLNEDFTTNAFYLDNWPGSHMHLSQNAMPLILEKFKKENLI